MSVTVRLLIDKLDPILDIPTRPLPTHPSIHVTPRPWRKGPPHQQLFDSSSSLSWLLLSAAQSPHFVTLSRSEWVTSQITFCVFIFSFSPNHRHHPYSRSSATILQIDPHLPILYIQLIDPTHILASSYTVKRDRNARPRPCSSSCACAKTDEALYTLSQGRLS